MGMESSENSKREIDVEKNEKNNYLKHFQPIEMSYNRDNYIGPLELATSTQKQREEQMPNRYVLKDYGQPDIFDVETESYLFGLKCDHSNKTKKGSGCVVTRGGDYKNGYFGRKLGGVERPLIDLPPSYIYDDPEKVNQMNSIVMGHYDIGSNKKQKCGKSSVTINSYLLELDNSVKVGADTRYR